MKLNSEHFILKIDHILCCFWTLICSVLLDVASVQKYLCIIGGTEGRAVSKIFLKCWPKALSTVAIQ